MPFGLDEFALTFLNVILLHDIIYSDVVSFSNEAKPHLQMHVWYKISETINKKQY